MKHNKKNTKKN